LGFLDFVITLFFAFGIAFEVPVATVLVVAVGITTPDNLVKIRPYVFVAAFIIGMFLTPPDMISQTLLAIPMWLLYEVGIVFSRIYKERIKDAGVAREARFDDDGSTESSATDTAKTSSTTSEKTASAKSVVPTAAAQAATSTNTVKKDSNDNESDKTDTESFFDPALMQKPGPSGTFRNSLTDFDDDQSDTTDEKPTNDESSGSKSADGKSSDNQSAHGPLSDSESTNDKPSNKDSD